MVSFYSCVLCILLAGTSISVRNVRFCYDVTGIVNDAIVAEVKEDVPNLVYNASYFILAQKYGIEHKKPQPEDAYIYLDKEGEFLGETDLNNAARRVIWSVSLATIEALNKAKGTRPYACVALRCTGTARIAKFVLQIACVARKATDPKKEA